MSHDITKDEFESIFREYYSRIYYYVLQFIQEEETAQDIVSECFWITWKNKDRIQKDKIVNYLFICAKNKCLSQIKKSKHQSRISEIQNSLLVMDNEEKWKEREERYAQIEEALETLTPRTRLILQKCYMEHLTYKEVASMLDITTDGVKKHIVKALSILRAKFNIDKHKQRYP